MDPFGRYPDATEIYLSRHGEEAGVMARTMSVSAQLYNASCGKASTEIYARKLVEL